MRGSGRTAKQIQDAPLNAVFVWCNGETMYARCLASGIGRNDVKVVSPSWLIEGWIGRTFTGVVVDHAADLSYDERRGLEGALTRVRAQ